MDEHSSVEHTPGPERRPKTPTAAMRERLLCMLQLQRMINDRMDPQWFAHRPPFLRAAIMAGAEAVNHYGYKWWEKQKPDLPRVRTALVEAFHFLISHEMLGNGRRDSELAKISGELVNMYVVNLNIHLYTGMDFVQKMDAFLARASTHEAAMWPALFSAMADVDMDWPCLNRMCFSENVLRLFRQDYGSESGAYSRIWDGKEDTIHLQEIIDSMHTLDITAVRRALVARYATSITGRRAADRAGAEADAPGSGVPVA